MRMLKGIAKAIGDLLCAVGFFWFLMPVTKGSFGIGCAFGAGICLLGLLLLIFYPRFAKNGGIKRLIVRIVAVCYVLGLAWCGYLTVLMNSFSVEPPPANTNVILLGSQVFSMERLGANLARRVEKTVEYLTENTEAVCIATGGQGSNEPCPESEAERAALMKQGVSSDRIFLETQSTDTRENMEYAGEVAEKNRLGSEFVIVTQQFHMYRSLRLAENAGFHPYALVADTSPALFPLYYGRELLSLTKWNIERIFLG